MASLLNSLQDEMDLWFLGYGEPSTAASTSSDAAEEGDASTENNSSVEPEIKKVPELSSLNNPTDPVPEGHLQVLNTSGELLGTEGRNFSDVAMYRLFSPTPSIHAHLEGQGVSQSSEYSVSSITAERIAEVSGDEIPYEVGVRVMRYLQLQFLCREIADIGTLMSPIQSTRPSNPPFPRPRTLRQIFIQFPRGNTNERGVRRFRQLGSRILAMLLKNECGDMVRGAELFIPPSETQTIPLHLGAELTLPAGFFLENGTPVDYQGDPWEISVNFRGGFLDSEEVERFFGCDPELLAGLIDYGLFVYEYVARFGIDSLLVIPLLWGGWIKVVYDDFYTDKR